MGKVIKIAQPADLNDETIAGHLSQIHLRFNKPLDINILLNTENKESVLVKSSIAVSSYGAHHNNELAEAIVTFTSYLDNIAESLNGEVSRTEGFYNNSKLFKRLFDS